jgi:hypothetical protein
MYFVPLTHNHPPPANFCVSHARLLQPSGFAIYNFYHAAGIYSILLVLPIFKNSYLTCFRMVKVTPGSRKS